MLAAALETTAPIRRKVARLPLLTTKGWKSERPVFAADDKPLQEALGRYLPMWVLPCALESLGELPRALGVEVISRDSLPASGLRGCHAPDEAVIETWHRALEYLADYVADVDEQMWQAGSWAALRALQLVVAPHLSLKIVGAKERVVALEQAAHLDVAANTLFFRDEAVFLNREIGGLLIGKFFARDRREIALAFVDAWRRAEEGPPREPLRLTEGTAAAQQLKRLGERAGGATGKQLFSGAGASPTSLGPRRTARAAPPRILKDFRHARIGRVEITEQGKPSQTIKRRNHQLTEPPIFAAGSEHEGNTASSARNGGAAPRAYTEIEREDEALRLLAAALKTIDDVRLHDYRHLPVGADSVDELRRFFEIKAFAGEMRDEIRLGPSRFKGPSVTPVPFSSRSSPVSKAGQRGFESSPTRCASSRSATRANFA